MKTLGKLLHLSASSSRSQAAAALIALALTPACSSGSEGAHDTTAPVATGGAAVSSSSSGGPGKPSSTTAGTTGATASSSSSGHVVEGTGGAGSGGSAGNGGAATTRGSGGSSAGQGGGSNMYADPTCEGLTLDPWTRDADGWTVLPDVTQPGRRVIYVSASNAGKTSPDPSNPSVYYVTTAEDGVALLRSGQPDSLLFNRGETFTLAASIDSHGLNGGASTADAKVIGAYGKGARPVLIYPEAHSVIAVESYAAQYLIITQLDLEPEPSLKVQGTGMTLSSPSLSHVLVEDVKINGFQKGLDIESGTDAVVRRSEILNSCGGYRSQGMYVQAQNGFTLDENMMDQNGLQVCGDATSGSPEGQGVYVQSFNACFRARGNVMSRSLGNTLEARIGGDIQGNVFVGSNTALNYGYVLGGSIEGKQMPRGVYGQVTNNVFLSNVDGVNFGNTAEVLFSDNVLATTTYGAIYIQASDGIGIHGLTISDNSVSQAKYFVSYQGGLPAGPVIVKNDGVNTQISDCDGAFGAKDAYTNGVLIFQYQSTKGSCQIGLEMNGGDIYSDATPSVKVVDSSLTGILMKPTEAPVFFKAPNALTDNHVSYTGSPFEKGTTMESTNPATFVPETGDDLKASFVNPSASIADVLGSDDKFYAAMAAQSHDAWNSKITAAALVPYFQAAYKAK